MLYIQADDDRFCRAIVGIGNSADCWANVLQTNITVITCSGDHFSMMDPSRAPDIGSILTLSASLIYRSLLPNLGRIPKNACHKASLQLFRQHGLKVSFIGKRCKSKIYSYFLFKHLNRVSKKSLGVWRAVEQKACDRYSKLKCSSISQRSP